MERDCNSKHVIGEAGCYLLGPLVVQIGAAGRAVLHKVVVLGWLVCWWSAEEQVAERGWEQIRGYWHIGSRGKAIIGIILIITSIISAIVIIVSIITHKLTQRWGEAFKASYLLEVLVKTYLERELVIKRFHGVPLLSSSADSDCNDDNNNSNYKDESKQR